MSSSSVAGVILALLTFIVAALPLAMSLHLNLDGDKPVVQQALVPADEERSTMEQLFDSEAMRLGLEQHKKSR